MESSFWQGLADNPTEERSGWAGSNLPANAWVVVDTATKDNGKAAPEIRSTEGKGKNEGKTYLIFKTGMSAVGGDSNLRATEHEKSMVFAEFFVYPGEEELKHNPRAVLSGRFTGFLNAVYASGVAAGEKDPKARSAARWAVTIQALGAIAQAQSISVEQYDGQIANFLAATAAAGMQNQPYRMLIKTKLETYDRKDGGKGEKTTIAAFEDATPENMTNRKAVMFTASTNGVSY